LIKDWKKGASITIGALIFTFTVFLLFFKLIPEKIIANASNATSMNFLMISVFIISVILYILLIYIWQKNRKKQSNDTNS